LLYRVTSETKYFSLSSLKAQSETSWCAGALLGKVIVEDSSAGWREWTGEEKRLIPKVRILY
jgi:hypothetical protein